MSWWTHRHEAEATTGGGASAVAAVDPDALEQALDTVGAFLRTYGHHAFDTEACSARELNQACEAWCRHLLAGGPRPGTQPGPEALPLRRRDWRGVRQFLAGRRREESLYVGRTIGDFRDILWRLIQILDHLATQEQDSDERMHAQLSRLRVAAQGPSTEKLRREVLSAVDEIARIADERKRREIARMAGLHSRVKQLGDQLAVARHESTLDPLTGIYNRRGLDERLAQAVSMAHAFRQPASLLLIDLDHFKRVNDTYGHLAGDEVLRQVAHCLACTFRVRNDFVARFGGEEFAVILWNTSGQHAASSGQRVLAALRALRVKHASVVITLTASIGVAEVRHDDSVARWLERSDRALYEAKRRGRDRLVQIGPDGLFCTTPPGARA